MKKGPLTWDIFMHTFLKQLYFKSLGPHTWTWTKRSGHAPKSGCADFFNTSPKREILGFFFTFGLLPFFPSNYGNVWQKKKKNQLRNIKAAFLCHCPWHLERENLFCPSHRKTHWTMIMDNIGLQIGLFGTSSSMVTLTFFSWCNPNWSNHKFNGQSQVLEEKRTTSWSMM